jgi:OOP family OmpA-OmpF porin
VARYDLDAAGRASLDRFAACLVERGEPAVIEGHTDPRGGDAYNERLAERRAQEAARYLEGRGVAAGRLTVRAAGSTSPVCTEATEVCNAQNRRVEAVVGPP